MERQRILVWTGGHHYNAEEDRRMADAFPFLPDPAPLRRALRIAYTWGDTKFDIIASACSVRIVPWRDEQQTWLHCKAMTTAEVKADQPTPLMNVLIPARYVTAIEPGPTFRLAKRQESEDIGVLPPNQPAPLDALPLSEVERVITELLTPERN